MQQRQKIWLSRRAGRDSAKLTPRFQRVTLERFESTCLLLGLDPDDVRGGTGDIASADLADPYTTGSELLGIMLKNADDFDLTRFEKPAAEEFIAVLVADFFFSCIEHFEQQKLDVLTMLRGAALTPSEALLMKARRSLASFPA